MIEQFKMFGISKENMGIDDVLILMDLFALPYKAVVLLLSRERCDYRREGQKSLSRKK